MPTNSRDAVLTLWTFYSIIILRNKEKTQWKVCIRNAYILALHICPRLTGVLVFILNKIKELMLKADTPKEILQTLTALHIFNNRLISTYMCNVPSCSIWIIPHLNKIFFLLFKKSYKAGVLTKNQNSYQKQVHKLQETYEVWRWREERD